jgi:hypothetical protein
LKYQTAIATLIQFVSLTLLNVANGAVSVVSQCHSGSTNCVSNLLSSLVFFLLISIWFGCVWILGFTAQDRRSKRLAQLLILIETMIAIVALFNAKHHTDPLSLITSLIDFGLSIWVITLAHRLIKADGGRVVSRQRNRKHHDKHDQLDS